MKKHVMKTVSNCFAALRQIHSVRRSVTRPVLLSLVTSLVISRLDYGNATLAGLPVYLSNRLQSVLNAGARLVYSALKYDHVTSLLQELHWLRVPQRIDYKLAVLTFRCLHGQAPSYLTDCLRRIVLVQQTLSHIGTCGQRWPIRWSFRLHATRPSATVLSLPQRHESGTACRRE